MTARFVSEAYGPPTITACRYHNVGEVLWAWVRPFIPEGSLNICIKINKNSPKFIYSASLCYEKLTYHPTSKLCHTEKSTIVSNDLE